MASYAYKDVDSQIPRYIIEAQGADYEGLPGYDGDLWDAASAYISDLEEGLRLALAGKSDQIKPELLKIFANK